MCEKHGCCTEIQLARQVNMIHLQYVDIMMVYARAEPLIPTLLPAK